MSAMFVVMKMFYTHQDTRDFWQESYTTCMDKLMGAEARWETDQAYVALGNLHTQMEQVDQ